MSENCSVFKVDISLGLTITVQVLLAASLVVAAWALAILLRCGSHLPLKMRLAVGHFLGIDVGSSITGFFAFNLAINRRSSAEQVFYWLVILNWQEQVAILLLVVISVTMLLDFDHMILIMITSWAFSSSPILYIYALHGSEPVCSRPTIWKPFLTISSNLVVILPMFMTQLLLCTVCIYWLLTRRKKPTNVPIRSNVTCSRCKACGEKRRRENGLSLMLCLVVAFLAYTLPQSLAHSFLASIASRWSEQRYAWTVFMYPGLSGIVDGAVVLYFVRRLCLPTGINPCARKNKQGHIDGGDHSLKRDSQWGEPCTCQHCRHYLSARRHSTGSHSSPLDCGYGEGQLPK